MNFLPFENITYHSKLDETKIIRKLKDNVQLSTSTGYGHRERSKRYEGEIGKNSFNIKRIIWYRNSFLPQISGTIISEKEGTRIKVKMRLHLFVLIFICVFCSILVIALLVGLYASFLFNHLGRMTLFPLGMLAFAYLMTIFGFNFESRKSKKDLKEILEAEIE